MKNLKMPKGWKIITSKEQQELSDSQSMHDIADKRLNETLERFRHYNDGTDDDILEMVDDWLDEKDALNECS